MWSPIAKMESISNLGVNMGAELRAARALMRQALILLDEFSLSAAAASLDMAIHQLDRELAPPTPE